MPARIDHAGGELGRWVGKLRRINRKLRFGRGSKTACKLEGSDMQARERMFQCEVFDKSQSARPQSVLLDLWRIGSIGLSYQRERMAALFKSRNQTISCIGWLEEAHRTSSHSVAYLNGRARLGQSLECGEARRRDCLLFRAYTHLSQRADDGRRRSGQSHERAVPATLARLRRPDGAAGPILVRFPSVETLG